MTTGWELFLECRKLDSRRPVPTSSIEWYARKQGAERELYTNLVIVPSVIIVRHDDWDPQSVKSHLEKILLHPELVWESGSHPEDVSYVVQEMIKSIPDALHPPPAGLSAAMELPCIQAKNPRRGQNEEEDTVKGCTQ